MAVFLDTGVSVVAKNADDDRHRAAKDLIRSALRQDYAPA